MPQWPTGTQEKVIAGSNPAPVPKKRNMYYRCEKCNAAIDSKIGNANRCQLCGHKEAQRAERARSIKTEAEVYRSGGALYVLDGGNKYFLPWNK